MSLYAFLYHIESYNEITYLLHQPVLFPKHSLASQHIHSFVEQQYLTNQINIKSAF